MRAVIGREPADDVDRSRSWHLDRRVPIAIILTLAAQVAIGVWWASKLDSRVERLEQAQVLQRERDQRQDRQMADADAQQERRLLDAVAQLRAHLDRIDAKLDRLIEKRLQR